MLFFARQRLAFLEVPKTGSSAVSEALAGEAAMAIHAPQKLRHMAASVFDTRTRRYITETWGVQVETFAVMREPLDRLASWYRYLQRPYIADPRRSTVALSFEEFVEDLLERPKTRFEGVGRQDIFLMNRRDELVVQHLFQYDRQDILLDFLTDRFGHEVSFDRVNVSTADPVELSERLREKLRERRGPEMALWDRLAETGYIQTPRN